MRIIHTSDWHIGQTFFDYERKEEHLLFLSWLLEQIELLKADVLLIAGDVFDSPNPSAESQRIFYRFIRQMTSRFPQLQCVIIAGNHDSAARLEAPTPLLEAMNISIKGVVSKKESEIDYHSFIVPLKKDQEEIICLAVPYLRQGDYPANTSDDTDNHSSGILRMYQALIAIVHQQYGPSIPCIAMGHLQATGSQLSDTDRSERTIIGGLEAVAPDVFRENTVYTALGHLHKAQQVGGVSHVRYSGTPLPMSFAEKHYRHGITFVEIRDAQMTQIEQIDFDTPIKLLSIPTKAATLEVVLQEIDKLPEGEINSSSPYLEIKVLNDGPDPARKFRIEEALQSKSVRLAAIHAVDVRVENIGKELFTFEKLQAMTPMELALSEYERRYGETMPSELQSLLKDTIHELELQSIE